MSCDKILVKKNYSLLLKYKRQKKSVKNYSHCPTVKKIKDEYFGNNAAENLEQYNAAMANLDEVYQAEVKAAGDNA